MSVDSGPAMANIAKTNRMVLDPGPFRSFIIGMLIAVPIWLILPANILAILAICIGCGLLQNWIFSLLTEREQEPNPRQQTQSRSDG